MEIGATREKAISALKEKGYEIVNTLFTGVVQQGEDGGARSGPDPLWRTLEKVSLCLQPTSERVGKSPDVQDRAERCCYGLTILYVEG